jgi:hypothetical protein
MRTGNSLSILAHILNVLIFLYFTIELLLSGALDLTGLLISSIGLLASFIADIVSTLE